MSELKPKRDNERAADQIKGGVKANMPHPSTETKPHGDKLRDVFEDEPKKPKHKSH